MSGGLLYLLRHGEPELTGRMLGRTDCAVTARGIAACLEQIEAIEIKRIVSSDLKRAQACADAIGQTRGIGVALDPRWREIDFGEWDGLRSAQIDPGALGQFWNDPDASPPPGGERWSAMTARVSAAIEHLGEQTTLVVTHGGAMRAALHVLCGFGQRQLWAFDLPYAALLALRVWPGAPRSAQIVGLWP
ncbi:MAG: histidine phosphatase family protein [Sphingomonadales bacterium]|nr:MAG: histidine phosphatase family protein [Sphingomonadales bacterium]